MHPPLRAVTIPSPLLAPSGSYIYANSGDDSVHLVGNVSEGKVYLDAGDDSVSINAGLIAGSIYGGEGTDTVYIVDGASTFPY